MTEYTVHFQRGTRVGTRSLRMVPIEADSPKLAVTLAKQSFADHRAQGYRIVRVDHFDEATGRLTID